MLILLVTDLPRDNSISKFAEVQGFKSNKLDNFEEENKPRELSPNKKALFKETMNNLI